MKAALSLELFGDNVPRLLGLVAPQRPWVAEVHGIERRRVFLRGKKGYERANSVGSRGVTLNYVLSEGRVYEVREQKTWRAWDHYFCFAADGRVWRIPEDQVETTIREVEACRSDP